MSTGISRFNYSLKVIPMSPIVSGSCLVVALFSSALCHATIGSNQSVVPEPGYEVVTQTVGYGDLNLGNSQGVATLYRRIKTAASGVCKPPLATTKFNDTSHLRHCQEQAVTQAVKDVNSVELSQLHVAMTNQ
jgi:UrcA family protein